jgi:hypothetical protein
MSKKEKSTMLNKRLDIAELIKKAEEIKKKKSETKELKVKSLNGSVLISKPGHTLISDSYDMGDNHEADKYIIYESVLEPNFKDKALQEAYGVEGYDILDEIFDPGEIGELSKKIIEFAGYGNSVEEIKN